jgi:hypothetical protein
MAKNVSQDVSALTPDSDAWSRFERAVDAAVNSGPKHKVSENAGVDKKALPLSKGRSEAKSKKDHS